jgi:hypothetical protein
MPLSGLASVAARLAGKGATGATKVRPIPKPQQFIKGTPSKYKGEGYTPNQVRTTRPRWMPDDEFEDITFLNTRLEDEDVAKFLEEFVGMSQVNRILGQRPSANTFEIVENGVRVYEQHPTQLGKLTQITLNNPKLGDLKDWAGF